MLDEYDGLVLNDLLSSDDEKDEEETKKPIQKCTKRKDELFLKRLSLCREKRVEYAKIGTNKRIKHLQKEVNKQVRHQFQLPHSMTPLDEQILQTLSPSSPSVPLSSSERLKEKEKKNFDSAEELNAYVAQYDHLDLDERLIDEQNLELKQLEQKLDDNIEKGQIQQAERISDELLRCKARTRVKLGLRTKHLNDLLKDRYRKQKEKEKRKKEKLARSGIRPKQRWETKANM
ncbi:unnamed protein product [Didymodactylos carnosus]|uniref:Uncharacterized protein n=1 Tax=Didymodactylos carnosus TaxID=1234261 RepID=A0A814V0S2_9BILA|nr:unnamed protein product [Didymodactylos carnosus]CAF3946845.1 unnamed protein product [Didymodactylos carnosus]